MALSLSLLFVIFSLSLSLTLRSSFSLCLSLLGLVSKKKIYKSKRLLNLLLCSTLFCTHYHCNRVALLMTVEKIEDCMQQTELNIKKQFSVFTVYLSFIQVYQNVSYFFSPFLFKNSNFYLILNISLNIFFAYLQANILNSLLILFMKQIQKLVKLRSDDLSIVVRLLNCYVRGLRFKSHYWQIWIIT